MAVVARLNCISVEHNAWNHTVAKLQPVVPADDPHDEEIKQFFAATPAGVVTRSVAGDDADVLPGQQYYLKLERVKGERDPGRDSVAVSMVRLDGWATAVALAKNDGKDAWKLEFTIRNEMAAEQFQPGAEFYVTLEPIDG